ncbi:MAG: adenosylcobinamide-GDP ribazoletransferase [Chloroflexaceae bacterium]|nr:adenosylcobinamide-GDP ribazoletransferase [Chloroflexaceae bacterium]
METETPHENGTPRNPWGPFAPLGEALRFLTILPMIGLPPMTERSVVQAIPWFPLAGLVIGALLLPVGWLGGWGWGALVQAALVVVVWGVVTGGLHLDGLSDTFDAAMSWRPRERKLEIMKDSRIGAMGALAIVALLLLKVGFLASAGAAWWQAVLLAPVLGRWADIYGIFNFPAAREGGLGRTFSEQVQQRDFYMTTVAALALAFLIGQWHGLVALLLVWGAAHLLGMWWTRSFGGLTGDTYGALCEIGEVIAIAAIAFMQHS